VLLLHALAIWQIHSAKLCCGLTLIAIAALNQLIFRSRIAAERGHAPVQQTACILLL
jgi:hypothetical protein